MTEVVIIDAVRTPVGRRGGGLSTMHPGELLGVAQKALIDRTGIDPAQVGQVVTGCVSQVGEQAFNIGRTAWLAAGLPQSVANTTVDTQCGSSQQATSFATALVGSGVVDVAVACGVETMSRIPIGSSGRKDFGLGIPIPKTYFPRYEMTSQFEGAERIADKWGISRADTDAFGLRSQQLAAQAWAEDRFGTQIVPVTAPDADEEGNLLDTTHEVTRDEGLRETTLEKLGTLKPVARPDGVHTAGSASQISDGAAAVLIMTADKAKELGLTPKARIVDTCNVGVDPVLMLTGPIDATTHLLERTGMTMSDIGVTEINEAFASVVLSWAKEHNPDMDTVNPNGGAIALGHPLGGTGAVLLTKALHELERADKENALITMCCGGGLGTGTIIQRV
ncbi:steroid 3-ketoacyl-CoA thiolase [Actinospongicola halichondriae]|uniref:steroid 3-ketoacyl-CoA thiolase n=1 Tax=Actinospongicola halichondriae TaxID=3236844 RepID=UPI003D382234